MTNEIPPEDMSNNTNGKAEFVENPIDYKRNLFSSLSKSSLVISGIILTALLFGLGGYWIGRNVSFTRSLTTPTPSLPPTSHPTPTPTLTPTNSPPTPTQVVAQLSYKRNPTPTPTPTPKEVVNPNFKCGKYEPMTYPSFPALGSPPLLVTLMPSGGISEGYVLAGFQWDYDGDGKWDSGTIHSETTYTYTKQGVFKPRFRVVSTDGTYGPPCEYPFEVKVVPSVDYENDTIIVDKLYREFTISKSKQNYTFSGPEKYLNNGGPEGDKIFIPFVTISSKNKFTAIRIKTKPDTYDGYGHHEGGRDLRAGTAYHQHIYINKNKPVGTYNGELIFTYTTGERGEITKEGPTLRYKIRLTE